MRENQVPRPVKMPRRWDTRLRQIKRKSGSEVNTRQQSHIEAVREIGSASGERFGALYTVVLKEANGSGHEQTWSYFVPVDLAIAILGNNDAWVATPSYLYTAKPNQCL